METITIIIFGLIQLLLLLFIIFTMLQALKFFKEATFNQETTIEQQSQIIQLLTPKSKTVTKPKLQELIPTTRRTLPNDSGSDRPVTTCRKCDQQFRMLEDTDHVFPICPNCN